MKLGLSTIMHRDRRLDRHLMEMYQQAGVDSIELTDYHPDFSFGASPEFTTYSFGAV